MVKVLSDERRRQMILDALQPGVEVKATAKKYGINRNALHDHINRAVRNRRCNGGKAEAEAAFRRKVWELVR